MRFINLLTKVWGVFLDISNAFDKAWYDGTIFQVTQNEISGKLLNLLRYLLSKRRQRVVPKGQVSTWTNVPTRVPEGTVIV